jgi:hypothetical protein
MGQLGLRGVLPRVAPASILPIWAARSRSSGAILLSSAVPAEGADSVAEAGSEISSAPTRRPCAVPVGPSAQPGCACAVGDAAAAPSPRGERRGELRPPDLATSGPSQSERTARRGRRSYPWSQGGSVPQAQCGRWLSARRSAAPVRRSRPAARRGWPRRRRPSAVRSSGRPDARRSARGAAWPPRRPGS